MAAKVATSIDESGRIVQLAPFQDIAYGEMDGTRSARMQALDLFLQGFFDEVVSTIAAVGVPVSEGCIAFAQSAFLAKGSTLTSSMYRDFQANQPVEADQIIGDLLSRGREAGLSTPLLETAYAHLSVYQTRLAAPASAE